MGAVAVAVSAAMIGLTVSPASAAQPTDPAPGSTDAARPANPIETNPNSALGDLRPFAIIVDDIGALAHDDLTAAAARGKDLEVAWDGAESALKPTSPDDWHTMDDGIDTLLTALRAQPPSAAEVTAAVTGLQDVIAGLQAK